MGFLFWVLVHPKIKAAFEKIGCIRMHSQRQKAVYDGSPPLQHHLPRDTRLCEEELFFLAHLKRLPFVEICPVESFLLFTPTASQKGKKCKKKKKKETDVTSFTSRLISYSLSNSLPEGFLLFSSRKSSAPPRENGEI